MKYSDPETNLIVIESSWMNQFFSDSECILVIKLVGTYVKYVVLNGLYDIFDIFVRHQRRAICSTLRVNKKICQS